MPSSISLGRRKCIYADKKVLPCLGQRHVRVDTLLSDKQRRKMLDKVEKAEKGSGTKRDKACVPLVSLCSTCQREKV